MIRQAWQVEPEWRGETAAILAGGPSLTPAQALHCKAAGWRVITINNAWELLPTADIAYFCDLKWWNWHGEKLLAEFVGRIVTLENFEAIPNPRVFHLMNYGGDGFSVARDGVKTGSNSGYQALHLAAHLAAKRVVLLGYDMRWQGEKCHWHDPHPVGGGDRTFYQRRCIPALTALKPELDKRGVEVINATPDSALDAFEKRTLDSIN